MNVKNTLMLILIPLGLCVLYACANTTSIARVHPEEVKGFPNCADCHSDRWAAYSHNAHDFYAKHGLYAQEHKPACNACHRDAFCMDCHAHREEILPSDKYKDAPLRALPHRGDYISQHRVDGRINPASCLKCHGRQNNERCKTCHR